MRHPQRGRRPLEFLVRRGGPWLAALACTAPAALSQTAILTIDGANAGDLLGAEVAGGADLNADGVPDLVAGAPGADAGGVGAGRVRVFSGLDGSILDTWEGAAAGDGFGTSVDIVGDVDGDGVADVVVGAPKDDSNGQEAGRAEIRSGLDGSTLRVFLGDAAGDYFGAAVAGAGDVDGDGTPDVIVGAAGNPDAGGSIAGFARVFSGLDGSVLYTFLGAAGSAFGSAVGGAGDVDADGFADVVASGPYNGEQGKNTGRVRVFSGFDGTVIHTFYGEDLHDRLGRIAVGVGDVNGDGHDDVIATAEGDDDPSNSGSATVFSGLDGTPLYMLQGAEADRLGWAAAGVGDVDGDGFDDLVVGAQGGAGPATVGYVRLHSGVDGDLLYLASGDPDAGFGNAAKAAGDVDQDGFPDLVVGAHQADVNGSDCGRVQVLSGRALLGTSYCTPAVDNSTGQPGVLQAYGSALVSAELFHLAAGELPTKQFGYFLASQTQGFVQNPGGSQGNLCLGGTIGRFVKQVQSSGLGGTFAIPVDLSSMPPPAQKQVLPGETWSFQAWYRDKNPQTTSNFTDAVAVTFQ